MRLATAPDWGTTAATRSFCSNRRDRFCGCAARGRIRAVISSWSLPGTSVGSAEIERYLVAHELGASGAVAVVELRAGGTPDLTTGPPGGEKPLYTVGCKITHTKPLMFQANG